MQQRGVIAHRIHGAKHRRQLLVIDIDKLDGSPGGLLIDRGHHSDSFSHKADLILGQHRDIAQTPPIEDSGYVGARKHEVDAWQLLGVGSVDGFDRRVGQRTPQHLGPEHPRQ